MTSSFDLVVRTPAGAVQTLVLNAVDMAAARIHASQAGHQVLTCNLRKAPVERTARSRIGMRPQLDIASLSYELSSLMAAGLSVMEALRTLSQKERSAARRAMILDVVAGVNEGMPLSGALGRHPGRYPPLLIATVSASEQTGDLSTALRR
jgi:general secretion pathway protein F